MTRSSSKATATAPLTTRPTCSTLHRDAPTAGPTSFDHRHPGWKVGRPTVSPPNCTTSKRPLGKTRTSPCSKRLRSMSMSMAILRRTIRHVRTRRLVSLCSAPLARCHPERSAEPVMEVALIDEAEIGGDDGDLLPSSEAALGFFETQMAKIAVHRHAVSPLETSTELKSTHRRQRRELAHRHRFLHALMQVVANAAQRRIVIARGLG